MTPTADNDGPVTQTVRPGSAPTAAPDSGSLLVGAASWSPTGSPDSAGIAFVSDRSGAPRLWVRLGRHGPATMPGLGQDPVVAVSWSRDGHWLASVVAPGGAARTEVWVMRPDGSDRRQVAGFGRRSATFGAWTHGAVSWLPIAESGGEWSDGAAYLVDPATGRRRPVADGGLLHTLDASADHRFVLVRRGRRTARWVEIVDLADGSVRVPVPRADVGSTDLAHFADGGRTVLLRTDAGRDFAALVATPTAGGDIRVVASRANAELERFTISGDGRTAALLWNVHGGRSALSVLDVASGDERVLDAVPGDVLSSCELSGDGRRLLVTAEAPSQPPDIWSVDVVDGAARRVRSGAPHVVSPTRRASRAPQLHHFRGEDGLELSGWLYPPADAAPGPTLLYFHGGPEAQARPVFNPLFDELVARGLTVFAPNVRGSSGFGRRFVNADNLHHRRAAITDVRAAAHHLLDVGIAAPDRMGCMGRSYGGYLTLVALTHFPDLFAVGVDVCGMVDLETFYTHTEPWIAAAAISKYGHPVRDRELLRELSPIHRIDALRAPLLVVHGAHDTNVPVHEAEQIVAALEARRVPCELLLFDDEGHTIRNTANRAHFVRTVADWLAVHLDLRESPPAAPATGVTTPPGRAS